MTVFEFYFNKNGKITGFCVKGHSGYAAEGEDIVCAAVTGSVRMLEFGTVDILGEKNGAFHADNQNTEISFNFPVGISNISAERLELLMNMFFRYACALQTEFKQYISIEERRL